MKNDDKSGPPLRPATRLIRSGRDKTITGQFVNPPVIHASTVLFDTVEDMQHGRQRYAYGRWGTPTSEAFEAAMSDLEGSDGTVLCPSGLSAVSTALLAVLSAGDRILVTDSVYGPVRRFEKAFLKNMGVEVVYFDPTIGGGIEALFTPNTRAVYLESPGSISLEMQDVPAISAVAKRRGATVLIDNTWATPLYFRALDFGADISIISGTKYIVGHSDVMLGTAAARGALWPRLREVHRALGVHVGPDDMYLGLRGLRTMALRLERHEKSAMTVAQWLQKRPEVSRVLYPALETDPGHALWKRDMKGASGLFSFILKGKSYDQAKPFVDHLRLFGIGASWGGFESLVTLNDIAPIRTATKWTADGALIRLHIGLEDVDDLIEDLAAAFAHLAAG